MKRKPAAAQLHDLATTLSTPRCRGFCPSVRHTEQNEQCFGHPRTVCTEPHMYRPSGSRSQRAGTKLSASTRPPSYCRLQRALRAHVSSTSGQTTSPSPRDDGVRAAELVRLVGIERRVNAAEHDRRAPRPRGVPIS